LRIIKTLVAAAAAAATVAALSAAPALAEPINPHTGKTVTPNAWDIVGVGSETISFVSDQLAYNYDLSVKKDTTKTPYIYEWDAYSPTAKSATAKQKVTLKVGCPNTRPNGSSAGITALETYGTTKFHGVTYPCVNFARSSRGRSNTEPGADPSCATGGICFVKLANDVVTYATTKGSNAPDNLTLTQLADIFGCTVSAAHGDPAGTWGALLGSKAKKGSAKQKIDPLVPQSGSGTLKFWMETALGLKTDTEPLCGTLAKAHVGSQPEENEGIAKAFLLKNGKPNPNVLYPFSIASYVAQSAHSAALHHKPGKGQNRFGFDETGVLFLNGISGIAPTVKSHGLPIINPKWNSTPFRRYVYDVVPFSSAKGNVNNIPPDLVKFFGPRGYWCTHNSVLQDYGFEPIAGLCGTSS
jgi:ABC-type phosphate transport system substrate-binding protein